MSGCREFVAPRRLQLFALLTTTKLAHAGEITPLEAGNVLSTSRDQSDFSLGLFVTAGGLENGEEVSSPQDNAKKRVLSNGLPRP